MKKIIIILLITSLLTSAFKNNTNNEKITENEITSQPYKVELLDNTTVQTQNTLTLKNANDVNLYKIKVGDKILFTQPSLINLENGTQIPSGTKYSATVVMKEGTKIKIIINEIIFTDTKNYIIISNPKDIAPLKTISAERILGKKAKVFGTFRIGTVISSVIFSQRGIKSEPHTTTAVGICILLKTRAHLLKAGTPVSISFEKNIHPEIQILK